MAKAAEKGWDLSEGQSKESFYFDTIREVISLGGDTDTNACIVGGMIGSFLGIKNISDDLLNNYFKYDNVPEKFEQGKGRARA